MYSTTLDIRPNTEVLSMIEAARDTLRANYNIDIYGGDDFHEVLLDPKKYADYKNAILDAANVTNYSDRRDMEILMDNTRDTIIVMEAMNSSALSLYESFYFPLIPVFFPKLVAREAVTVSPIKNREVVKGFIQVRYRTYDGQIYEGPMYKHSDPRISEGLSIGGDTGMMLAVPGSHDVLAAIGMNDSQTHIERDSFRIIKVSDGQHEANVNIIPDIDGNFADAVTITYEDPNNTGTFITIEDYISGHVDWDKGIVHISSVHGNVTMVYITATASLEENMINTTTEIDIVKKRIVVTENKLQTTFTSEMLKDVQTAFDINYQTLIISTMAEQINNDIDRRIVNELYLANTRFNDPNEFRDTFTLTPPSNYVLGPKEWLKQISLNIGKLSSNIYYHTRIAEASVILANPVDSYIFNALERYGYDGNVVTGGNYGPVGEKVAGKYKLLTSPSVPKGKILILMKEPDETKTTYLFAPYLPGMLTPYPLGNVPSITMYSLNGSLLVRSKGIAVLELAP